MTNPALRSAETEVACPTSQTLAPDAQCVRTNRRGLFAFAAAAAALVGYRATPANATADVSVNGASTSNYGIAASTGASGGPIIPTINSTNHSIIGSQTSATVIPNGSGVLGARNGSGLAGVLGVNGSSGPGVQGVSDSAPGVLGTSTTGSAVRGVSANSNGLRGESTTARGCIAITAANSTPALVAQSTAQSVKVAALFQGNVRVEGDFAVTGAKAAAVPLPDGGLATVYCQESPEPFFEDFGRARLRNGAARIELEPQFASLVRADGRMVFLTPEGDCDCLYVHARDENGFEIRERRDGRSDIDFSYRIVGRRKDIVGERLKRLDTINNPPDNEPSVVALAQMQPPAGYVET